MVLFGFQTIDDGQRAIVWNHRGEGKVVDGPLRLTLWRSKVERLERYVAGQGEYIQYQNNDGNKVVLPGPCSLYENPIEHFDVHVHPNIFINSGECMVIYRGKQSKEFGKNNQAAATNNKGSVDTINSEQVVRVVKYGPCQYIPQPDEWAHEFKWHGSSNCLLYTSPSPRDS